MIEIQEANYTPLVYNHVVVYSYCWVRLVIAFLVKPVVRLKGPPVKVVQHFYTADVYHFGAARLFSAFWYTSAAAK